ncbi:hypothetical protein [Bacteroides heparinolyticus]
MPIDGRKQPGSCVISEECSMGGLMVDRGLVGNGNLSGLMTDLG